MSPRAFAGLSPTEAQLLWDILGQWVENEACHLDGEEEGPATQRLAVAELLLERLTQAKLSEHTVGPVKPYAQIPTQYAQITIYPASR